MRELSPLRHPLGKQGSACVEVMTTLHGSTPFPWRRAEGCVLSDRLCQGSFNPPIFSYRATSTLQAGLDPIKISFLHVGTSMDLQRCQGHNWVRLTSLQSLFGVIRNGYQIEYIWSIFLRTIQFILAESPSNCTLSSVSIFVGGFTIIKLDSLSSIRVGGRLTRVSDQSDQRSDQRDMYSQIVTVDQFAATMASIQEAIVNLGQMIDGQQTQQVGIQEGTPYDPIVPLTPPPSQSASQPIPFTLHNQTEVSPPPIILPTPISEGPTCSYGQT